MKKRTYRKRALQDVDIAALALDLRSGRLVVAIDVAKVDMVAALTDGVPGPPRVLATVAWRNPTDNGEFLALLDTVRASGLAVQIVMESSGTYGDVLRQQLVDRGFPVFRVSGKQTYDAREVYDGVPSVHDAKSAGIIAKLHLDGQSAPWCAPTDDKRRLQASILQMDLHHEHYLRLVHKLEGYLARHWPEISVMLELTSATLLAVLGRIGGPADLARDTEAARRLMRGMSHGLMSDEKIDAVVRAATTTAGVEMLAEERAALMLLASEAHRSLRAFKEAKTRVEALGADGPARAIAPVVGRTTAAVLVTEVGDGREFASVGAYLKAFGLNLKERSSGKHKGLLKLTKRGPSRARQYLWLATCRWLQKDRIARAWYEAKIARDGGRRAKAVTALMRKFAKALFHVARGVPLDSTKLFDLTRLRLSQATAPA
jgi:transposase